MKTPKRLVIVNGTMGAGKTAVCQALKQLAPPCAFLDGDWCWDMNPFMVTEETKELEMDNIVSMLNGFLACSAFETVIFCWVLHQQAIIDALLARLELSGVEVRLFTLMPAEETLRIHLEKDIAAGIRDPEVLERSLARLPLYEGLDTEKLPMGEEAPEEMARVIGKRVFG